MPTPRTLLPILLGFGCAAEATAISGFQETHACVALEYACDDGSCRPGAERCDGTAQCSAGEDEKDCGPCGAGGHQCGNGSCVAAALVCNRVAECADVSDELGCPVLDPPATECPRRNPHVCAGGLYECTADPTGLGCFLLDGGADACPADRPYGCPPGSDRDCSNSPDDDSCFFFF